VICITEASLPLPGQVNDPRGFKYMRQTEVYSGFGFFSAEIDPTEKACLPEVLALFKGGFNPKPARGSIGRKAGRYCLPHKLPVELPQNQSGRIPEP
jgi:hypothetical protein